MPLCNYNVYTKNVPTDTLAPDDLIVDSHLNIFFDYIGRDVQNILRLLGTFFQISISLNILIEYSENGPGIYKYTDNVLTSQHFSLDAHIVYNNCFKKWKYYFQGVL